MTSFTLNASNVSVIPTANTTEESLTSTQLVLENAVDGSSYTFTGSFSTSGTISGTITGLTQTDANGNVVYSFTGLNLPVSTYNNYVTTNNSAGLEAILFAGNDSITIGATAATT